jgi:hypothetical protein
MGACWGLEEWCGSEWEARDLSGSGGWPWAVGGFDVEAEEAAGGAVETVEATWFGGEGHGGWVGWVLENAEGVGWVG